MARAHIIPFHKGKSLMSLGQRSVVTADPHDFERDRRRPSLEAEPLWSRLLNRFVGVARGLSAHRIAAAAHGREPIFRVVRGSGDRWVVQRPGAAVEHAFPDLERAVAFIRHECLYKPATVELRVDDLYVVAQLDPNKPSSLFGEAVS